MIGGVPPAAKVKAVAEAEPTSAWQPPAPETGSICLRWLVQEQLKEKSSCSSWSRSNFWMAAVRTAGSRHFLQLEWQTKPIFALLCSSDRYGISGFYDKDGKKSGKGLATFEIGPSLAASPPVSHYEICFSLRPSSRQRLSWLLNCVHEENSALQLVDLYSVAMWVRFVYFLESESHLLDQFFIRIKTCFLYLKIDFVLGDEGFSVCLNRLFAASTINFDGFLFPESHSSRRYY